MNGKERVQMPAEKIPEDKSKMMKQIVLINPENVSEEDAKNYRVREAARAIVLDAEGKIAILRVTNKNYYKLPGGGLESSEDPMLALSRECQEEIGCDVDVMGEVGMIVEYRKMSQLKQVSYCYIAKIKGEKGQPNFTEDEKSWGFEQIWVAPNEALKLMQESQATNIEGKEYITPRDIAFLQEATQHLDGLGQ